MALSPPLRMNRQRALSLLLLLLLGVAPCASAQVSAKVDATAGQRALPLIDTDTLLYVENRGLDRIFVNLSGHHFRLVADPAEVDRAANAFPIPRTGEITIHVGVFIEPGDGNFVRLASQGPEEADADIVIAPVFVNGQTDVAYQIRRLDPLPPRLSVESYPNPFRTAVTLRYDIPARINSVDVEIVIFDALGRRIARLDEGPRFGGEFERSWTPAPSLASGVYFARVIVNGRPQETVPLVRVR